ncbi:hypothetical protein QUA54_34085, partial [Microcoleus sp. MOSTC5]
MSYSDFTLNRVAKDFNLTISERGASRFCKYPNKCKIVKINQYSGQFLKKDATPTASNAYAINHRS